MELRNELIEKMAALREDPQVQRRELMFAMALTCYRGTTEAERAGDPADAAMRDLARKHYVEALMNKDVNPVDAEMFAAYIEYKNSSAIELTSKLVSLVATLGRTASMRSSLPVHMQSAPSFAIADRVSDRMAQMLDGQEENYIAMMRCLMPRDYRSQSFVIGSAVRSDVEFDFVGTGPREKAERFRGMLNTLKDELGIDSLHVTVRDGKPSRGIVMDCKVTAEASLIKALAETYGKEPERFKKLAAQAAAPSRQRG